MYKRLGLRELKPTWMILHLADYSTKYPTGIIEDVLIKVGEFIFLVDFVVLKTKCVANPDTQIHVILG